MQHALSRLWQLAWRRSGGARLTLTLRDYEDIGLLRGALDQHAAEIIERLSAPAQAVVPRVFRALVAGASLADAVRRPMRLGELSTVTGTEAALVREVVDAFRARDCNFLRPSDDQALVPESIVDVSHESLIRQWTSLAEWFEAEAAAHALWGRLLFDQARHSTGQGELLSGLDLATALALVGARAADGWNGPAPTAADMTKVRHFRSRSRAAAEEARTRAENTRAEQQERRSLKRRTAVALPRSPSSVSPPQAVCLPRQSAARSCKRVQLTGANTNLQQSTAGSAIRAGCQDLGTWSRAGGQRPRDHDRRSASSSGWRKSACW